MIVFTREICLRNYDLTTRIFSIEIPVSFFNIDFIDVIKSGIFCAMVLFFVSSLLYIGSFSPELMELAWDLCVN